MIILIVWWLLYLTETNGDESTQRSLQPFVAYNNNWKNSRIGLYEESQPTTNNKKKRNSPPKSHKKSNNNIPKGKLVVWCNLMIVGDKVVAPLQI
jgi:hypothetical protein